MLAHVYTRWDKVHLQRGSECGDARDVGTDFTPPSILPMSVCAPHFHSGSDGAGCVSRQCLVLFPALPSEPLGGRPAVFIFLLPITHVYLVLLLPRPCPSASSPFYIWLPRQRAWQTQRPWLQRDPRHSSFLGTGFSSSFPTQSATSVILFTQESKTYSSSLCQK